MNNHHQAFVPPHHTPSQYVEMDQNVFEVPLETTSRKAPMVSSTPKGVVGTTPSLTAEEILRIRHILNSTVDFHSLGSGDAVSLDSEYPEFQESTHAWAVFADNPTKRASAADRCFGTGIILFQLFTYWMFAMEAIDDYSAGRVGVTISHEHCIMYNEEPRANFMCEAEYTNLFDAMAAFFMLAIFLAKDVLQAFRAVRDAPWGTRMFFAVLAGVEVIGAFVSACISVSYNLHIGEVTDAVAVGVGLLFIRELSQRAYAALRYGKTKQYKNFLIVVITLILIGMAMDEMFERWFAIL